MLPALNTAPPFSGFICHTFDLKISPPKGGELNEWAYKLILKTGLYAIKTKTIKEKPERKLMKEKYHDRFEIYYEKKNG